MMDDMDGLARGVVHGPAGPAAVGRRSLVDYLARLLRGVVHPAAVWYLRRSGGAFHANDYGPAGRYVVLMTEGQYGRWTKYEGQFWDRRTSALAGGGRD